MKKAKVRVTGNYVSRSSFTNRIDTILNLPVSFTEKDIADNISHLTTNASILKILAKRLIEIRKNNPSISKHK